MPCCGSTHCGEQPFPDQCIVVLMLWPCKHKGTDTCIFTMQILECVTVNLKLVYALSIHTLIMKRDMSRVLVSVCTY